MQKTAHSFHLEAMELERNFEEKLGREMTREEKRLFALSANFLDPPDEAGTDRVERRSNLRVMPSPPHKRVA